MDRRNRRDKEKSRFSGFVVACLHAFTSLVLGIFIVIWLLRGFGYESYKILSGSMEPTLTTGEIVLINTNDCDVKIGEVIAFQTGDHVIVHRVAEMISDGVYVTKGDANSSADLSPVEQWQILGTMWMKLGILTHVWLLFTSKGGVMVAIGLVVLHAIFDTLWNQEEEGEVGYA